MRGLCNAGSSGCSTKENFPLEAWIRQIRSAKIMSLLPTSTCWNSRGVRSSIPHGEEAVLRGLGPETGAIPSASLATDHVSHGGPASRPSTKPICAIRSQSCCVSSLRRSQYSPETMISNDSKARHLALAKGLQVHLANHLCVVDH